MNSEFDVSGGEAEVRRAFLKRISAATLATLGGGAPKLLSAADPVDQPKATADSCILIWMAGGMAAPETFDPKAYTSFRDGLPVEEMVSTFPSIDTSVSGLKISRGMEKIAQVMDRGTLIRSAVQPDLGSILHSRHQYHWLHRLCAAADRGVSTYWSLDGQGVGAH